MSDDKWTMGAAVCGVQADGGEVQRLRDALAAATGCSQRPGQAAYNAVRDAVPGLLGGLPRELDPFNDDSRLVAFCAWLRERAESAGAQRDDARAWAVAAMTRAAQLETERDAARREAVEHKRSTRGRSQFASTDRADRELAAWLSGVGDE